MTSPENPDHAAGIGSALVTVAAIGVLLVIVFGVASGGRAALGVGVGVAAAVSNLWVIGRVVRGFLTGGGSKGLWFVVVLVKLSLLFGGLYWLLGTGWVDLMPIIIGYGALPIGIVLAQLRGAQPVGEES